MSVNQESFAKFCGTCGAQRANEMTKFCGNCGKSLLVESESPLQEVPRSVSGYVERVNAFLSEKPIDTPSLFGMFIEALNTEPFPQDVWGADSVVGKRVVALFDSSQLMVTVSADGSVTIASSAGVDSEFDLKEDFPAVQGENEQHWVWSNELKAWISKMKITNEDLIQQMIIAYGEPEIILPWSRFVEDTESTLEIDEDAEEEFQSTLKLLSAFDEYSDIELPACTTKITLVQNNEYMPTNCGYSRFMQMVDDLNEAGWFIMWDECCGTCASGTRTSALESGEITPETPEFILWSQNVEGVFWPFGSVEDYVSYFFDLTKDQLATLEKVAKENNIRAVVECEDETEGKYTVQYSS